MRNYTKFTSSHAVDCTSFLSQIKKSSSNKYPIERDTVSLRKSVYEGKKWRLQHRHCFSIHSRYRYLSLDRFCHRHMIFPSRDTLNIFDTSSSFSKSSNFFFYNFLQYAKKENVKNSTVKCIKIKE